ncbi:MAG: hypothetical protein ACOYVF_13065, partial [Candidatus Zixiibacteriota bacterium]
CIERLCFEYIVLLTLGKRKLSKRELNLYKPKDLFKKILKESPYFEKMVAFINEFYIIKKSDLRMVKPDFKWLEKIHGKLGDYLHAQKEPPTNEEIQELFNLIHDSLKKIKSYLSGRANISKMRDFTDEMFNQFINDRITIEQVRLRLKLSDIPMHMLNPE